ncbi:hypothetical protein DSO57_1039204 [Entomophthora muscae]|uniref:Uncharacterized protein n=1 Tax=Entomophthora muscae TaxID=34485 RepID=A0ACC2UJC6_9FUNG|nr:hypothetical protein DSO57_1039204 [Entomophthora muscae]
MIADIVRRPDFHLPANTIGVLLSCVRNLPISDAECENLLGRILIRVMKGHTPSISSNLPALVSALGRVSQSQTVDMGMVLQCLPTNKQVPGIQHHIQYLLILLINAHELAPTDSSAFTGWFYCFDALQSTSLESLLEWLNPTQQHMLKRAHQEYLKHHKFVGKV